MSAVRDRSTPYRVKAFFGKDHHACVALVCDRRVVLSTRRARILRAVCVPAMLVWLIQCSIAQRTQILQTRVFVRRTCTTSHSPKLCNYSTHLLIIVCMVRTYAVVPIDCFVDLWSPPVDSGFCVNYMTTRQEHIQ